MTIPRLYPILDVGLLEDRGVSVVDAAQAMIDGGARILQWRCKAPISRGYFQQAERIAELCRKNAVLFIVNDRADIARLLDAGLHLGQDDLPPTPARDLIGPACLGLSTHNRDQLRAAGNEPIDYVALGPIFDTASKQNPGPTVGIENLRQWRELARAPLVAIGGMERRKAREVIESGADSVAVIGDLLPAESTMTSIRQRIEEWLTLIE